MAESSRSFRYLAVGVAVVLIAWSATVGAWRWTLAGGLLLAAFLLEFYEPPRPALLCPACRRLRRPPEHVRKDRCPVCGGEATALMEVARGVLFLLAVAAFVSAWIA